MKIRHVAAALSLALFTFGWYCVRRVPPGWNSRLPIEALAAIFGIGLVAASLSKPWKYIPGALSFGLNLWSLLIFHFGFPA